MANVAILGMQWGDEGKGKITDLLTPSFDVVARYQGGHNAGHTVFISGKKIILHLIPSGILHPGTLCLIGNGMVINPEALLKEMEELAAFGVKIEDNLVISDKAHLILPYHTSIESLSEEKRGDQKIGTTSRGIGPAYVDKAARQGVRTSDLLCLSALKDKIQLNVEEKNIYLAHAGRKLLDPQQIYEEYAGYAGLIGKYIKDTSYILDQMIKQGKSVLFEGAQGTLLDIDHGTYPYVTSSNSTVGGICAGLGLSPDKIDMVMGVTKAYTTRVGGGPFPTEIHDKWGEYLREQGSEYGASTGRPRRCGWLDAVALEYACRLNGVKKIVLTKADVLDGVKDIKVCVGYKYKGEKLPSFPGENRILGQIEPVYQSISGWENPVGGSQDLADHQGAFLDYCHLIEDLLEVEVSIISTGANRHETILVEEALSGLVNLEKVRMDL